MQSLVIALILFLFPAQIVQAKITPLTNKSLPALIQKSLADLDQYKKAQTIAGLQDPEIAYAMKKALVMADLLVSFDGQLNLAIVPLLKSYFIPEEPLEYEENNRQILEQLDSSWQPLLDQIVKPTNLNSYSTLMLRALFDLAPQEMLTDRHAKMAALAALFSPYFQGEAGDGFAVSNLIRDHEQLLTTAAQEYAEIIQNGYLTRQVDQNDELFFFLPILADPDRNKKLTIDPLGDLFGTLTPVLSTPGMAAACKAMGGHNIENLLSLAWNQLYGKSHLGFVKVTVDELIDACAQAISQVDPKPDRTTISAQGKYAFSALTNQPLLRAIEASYAGMTEARPCECIRANIYRSILDGFQPIWDKIPPSNELDLFRRTLWASCHSLCRLVYNPCIPSRQHAQGGFWLFKKNLSNTTLLGTQITTPNDFRSLVVDMLTLTVTNMGSSDFSQQLLKQCKNYVMQNNTFLQETFWSYDNRNRRFADPVTEYRFLFKTPMQTCDGDRSCSVDSVDLDGSFQTLIPKTANDLIDWCLNLAKTAPDQLFPMNVPHHAFNFSPGSHDLGAFTLADQTSDQWIREKLLIPGMKITQTQSVYMPNPIPTSAKNSAYLSSTWSYTAPNRLSVLVSLATAPSNMSVAAEEASANAPIKGNFKA